jgi:ABC-type glycerol-3-phosphate transport system substrate-binding protein
MCVCWFGAGGTSNAACRCFRARHIFVAAADLGEWPEPDETGETFEENARIKALAALKSGQSAPLSVLYSIDLYELIEQDVIVAWDDVATTPDDKAWLKAFYPALMMNGTYKGKAYGIPFQRSTIVLYWNKDAFKEAGLDPERPPANWT